MNLKEIAERVTFSEKNPGKDVFEEVQIRVRKRLSDANGKLTDKEAYHLVFKDDPVLHHLYLETDPPVHYQRRFVAPAG